MNKPDPLLRFIVDSNPKGGELWVNPAQCVAVACVWWNGARTQVVEEGVATLHIEGGRYFQVQGSPREVAERISRALAATAPR